MMSAKNEKHSLLATLFFQVAHYAIRPWPWIIVGLCTLVLYPELAQDEKRMGFIYVMNDFLPVGLKGMLVAAFFAAYMSTIATQLYWGASYLINDFYFLDKNLGFAVGENSVESGVILKTVNGGYSWTVQVDSLSAPLNAIHFKDGYGWAVGDNGLILKTIDSTYTSIREHKIKDNSNDIELQNYPNPFSTSTVISYQLPSIADVELSVYDLLGQKVVTFVKERQQPGSYEVTWDATDFPEGIYFYRLKVGSYVESRRMVLIK